MPRVAAAHAPLRGNGWKPRRPGPNIPRMEPAPDELAPEAPPRPSGNGIGIAGFVISLVGLILTCGVLCPVGLIFSLVGLGRQPKGLAIAGTVIGGIGSLLLVIGVLSVATRWQEVWTQIEFAMADVPLKAHHDQHGKYPDDEEGRKILDDLHDGWDHPLHYERTETGYKLESAGPDGILGNGDDLRHEK